MRKKRPRRKRVSKVPASIVMAMSGAVAFTPYWYCSAVVFYCVLARVAWCLYDWHYYPDYALSGGPKEEKQRQDAAAFFSVVWPISSLSFFLKWGTIRLLRSFKSLIDFHP